MSPIKDSQNENSSLKENRLLKELSVYSGGSRSRRSISRGDS